MAGESVESGRVHRARGRWFEELNPSDLFRHQPGRTVTEADNVLFSTMTMNTQSLHLDAFASKGTEFGERLVNSLFTLSLAVGLSVGDLTQGTTVANLGFEDISFPAPVYIGDTLYASTLVVARRKSNSRPGQGIVRFEHRLENQSNELVCRALRTALMKMDPSL